MFKLHNLTSKEVFFFVIASTLLLIQVMSPASPTPNDEPFKLTLRVENEVIPRPSTQNFFVVLINNNVRRHVELFVSLVKRGEVLEQKSYTVFLDPKEIVNLTDSLTFKPSLKPGIYLLLVQTFIDNSQFNVSQPVFVFPSLKEIYVLFQKYVEIKTFSEEAEALSNKGLIKTNFSRLINETNFLINSCLKLRHEKKFVEATKAYEKAEINMNLLNKEKIKMERSLFIYKLLSSIEDSLSFDAKIIFGFWWNFIVGSLFVFIIFLIVFPIYTSSPILWIENFKVLFPHSPATETEKTILYLKNELGKRIDLLLSQAFETIKMDIRILFLTAVAGIIAAIGLLTNNVAVLIGSMLISPIMVIAVADTYGWILSGKETAKGITGEYVFRKGFSNELKGVLAAVLSSYLVVSFLSFFMSITPSSLLMSRAAPNFSDLAIAIGAGFAGAVALAGRRKEISLLVGSAIAIALIPPASALGIGLAILRADIAFGAASLLIVNLIAIKFSSYLTAAMYLLYPLFKEIYFKVRDFWLKGDTYSLMSLIKNLFIYWACVSLSVTPPFGREEIKGAYSFFKKFQPLIWKTFKKFVTFIITPLFLIWFFGLIVSTPVSAAPSLLISSLAKFLSNLYSTLTLQVTQNILLEQILNILKTLIIYLLPIFLVSITLVYSLRILKNKELNKGTLLKFSVSSFLLWLFSSYLFNFQFFPKILTIYTLFFLLGCLIVVEWRKLKKYRSRIMLYGFVVFSLIYVTFQSIQVYQTSVYAVNVPHINTVSKEVIAAYLNLPTENLLVDSSLKKGILKVEAEVRMPLKNISKYQLSKTQIEQLNEILTSITGYQTEVTLKYIIST